MLCTMNNVNEYNNKMHKKSINGKKKKKSIK